MWQIPRYQQFFVLLGISCAGLAGALLLRWTGDAILPFLAAIFAGAWLFGFEGGLTVLVFAAVFALLMTVEQTRRGWTQVSELVGLGLLISWMLERDLRERHRFRSIASSMGDAVIAIDRNGVIAYMNAEAEGLFGISFRRAKKLRLSELAQFHDRKTGQAVELPIAAVLRGETASTVDTKQLVLTREGPSSDVEETIAPLRARNGQIEGVVLTIRDTTRRREAETQLSRSQKMDALARMAGGIAGDFNNLLTVITGYGAMLRDELQPGSPLRRFADEINSAAERSTMLTSQLMTLSRHQSAQICILDLNAAIAGMEVMLQRLLGKNIELVLIPGPGVLRVQADAGQMEQLIANLAMNSRDAMPEGGKFIIETASVEFAADTPGRPGSLAAGSYVLLTVSDTGIGMDTTTRSRLFEPFFTTKAPGKSTGLGLSIVYGIVTQGGGDISVYSEPGHGTIFEIYLPKSREQDAPVRKLPHPSRGSETILVVEDDDGVRKLVHSVLATRGYTVVEASDGKEALTLYQSMPGKFQMVLTDVVMPGLTGFELADRIAEIDGQQKVLYVTGFRDGPASSLNQDRLRLFLPKPFTPDALLARVREVLDERREAGA